MILFLCKKSSQTDLRDVYKCVYLVKQHYQSFKQVIYPTYSSHKVFLVKISVDVWFTLIFMFVCTSLMELNLRKESLKRNSFLPMVFIIDTTDPYCSYVKYINSFILDLYFYKKFLFSS